MGPNLRIVVPRATVVVLAMATSCAEPGRVERSWPVLGTTAEVRIHATNQASAERVADEVRAALARVEATFGRSGDGTAIERINREAPNGPVRVDDPDVYRALKIAREFASASDGLFDPTIAPVTRLRGSGSDGGVPAEAHGLRTALERVGWDRFELLPEHRAVRFLDDRVELGLAGMIRGHALDIAARNFALSGATGGTIDLGTEMYAWGRPPQAERWEVEISSAGRGSPAVARMRLRDRFVATSGDYRERPPVDQVDRFRPLDPRTGRPAESDVVAVTVIADRGAAADAFADAIHVGGTLRIARVLDSDPRLEAIVLVAGPDGAVVLASRSLRDRVTFEREILERVADRVRFLLPPERLTESVFAP